MKEITHRVHRENLSPLPSALAAQAPTHKVLITIVHNSRLPTLAAPVLLRQPLLEPAVNSLPLPSETHHFFIFIRLRSEPTLTVAMILGVPGTLREKQVSSKKLECSEYGMPGVSFHARPELHATLASPNIMNWRELPRMVRSDTSLNPRAWSRWMTKLTSGSVLVPAGDRYVHPVGRKASTRSKSGSRASR